MYAPHDTRAANLARLLTRAEAATTREELAPVLFDAWKLEDAEPCALAPSQCRLVEEACRARLRALAPQPTPA